MFFSFISYLLFNVVLYRINWCYSYEVNVEFQKCVHWDIVVHWDYFTLKVARQLVYNSFMLKTFYCHNYFSSSVPSKISLTTIHYLFEYRVTLLMCALRLVSVHTCLTHHIKFKNTYMNGEKFWDQLSSNQIQTKKHR